jgi:hypothetical protein
MAFDQTTRNRLNRFVADARKLLANEFTRQLQAIYGMNPMTGDIANIKTLMDLTPSQQESAQLLRDTFDHYLVNGEKGKDKERKLAALDRIVREQAFTVLNRIAALRMSEARGFLIESLANGYESKGFQLFHRIAGTSLGETGDAYRHYLFSIFDEFSLDLSVLFDRFSVQGRLFPSTPILIELLNLVNDDEVAPLWAEDETIGWIYQYFNSQEERKKMRDASQAPRNSRELAVRNQFFTPRYVVEFLTDNTLGRLWYEMTQGKTKLIEECEYLVRRPNEIFLEKNEQAPSLEVTEGLTQEELLKQTIYIEHRKLKDPRDIKMLDPACGSMHFGLYCFDLFERIYDEAWDIEVAHGVNAFIRESNIQALTGTYSDKTEFLKHVPRLIIENNIHGVDIDPRAAQVAGLSLWQRAHNSWQQAGIKPQQRPQILKSNIVCAEPMPGEKELLQEFTSQLKPTVLGQLVEVVFEKMELAGEAGTLLKIEKEIEEAIAGAKAVWMQQNQALSQFPDLAKVAKKRGEIDFDISDIDEEGFWQQAEQKILEALATYASSASSQMSGQKLLFASDAAKGFAFIDLCRKRFDIILMNPPFGSCSTESKVYIDKNYPLSSKDILCCFIERSQALLASSSYIGAITNRTPLFLKTYSKWRNECLIDKSNIENLVDLGSGVLDDAMVEASAYTLNNDNVTTSIAINLTKSKNKPDDLKASANNLNGLDISIFSSCEIKNIPNQSISYWISSSYLSCFSDLEPLGGGKRGIERGLFTSDDFRFLRLTWEVNKEIQENWGLIVKGGTYSPFVGDVSLFVNNKNSFREISALVIAKYPYLKGNSDWVLHPECQYGRKGITYPLRTTSDFAPRVLPTDCYWSHKGISIFPENDEISDIFSLLGVTNSSVFRYLVHSMVGAADGAAKSYEEGLVSSTPFPPIDTESELKISSLTRNIVVPLLLSKIHKEESIYFRQESMAEALEIDYSELSMLFQELDEVVRQAYKVTDIEFGKAKSFLSDRGFDILNSFIGQKSENKSYLVNRKINYNFGLLFGRWKANEHKASYQAEHIIDHAFNSSKTPLPSRNTGKDIIHEQVIKNVLKDYWTEDEGFSNFFVYHLKSYSMNKRQAPIYWPIESSESTLKLWFYYHNLNEETLYSCLNDFVEPKLDEVSSSLSALKSEVTSNPTDEMKIEHLTNSKTELEDFRDELVRLSRFWKPNHNDGVQIIAAPLWRLFRHKAWQKKLKQTWDKLEAGDFDWAHLAFSTWPERVLKKCHVDRSLAIAHFVESDLWHEVEVIKGRKKEPVWEWQPKPLSDSELRAYIKDKISTDERLKLYRSNNTNANGGAL